MVQRSSEGKRYGDTNKAHVNGLDRLEKYIQDMLGDNWIPERKGFIKIPTIYLENIYSHNTHDFDLMFGYKNKKKKRKLLIEIDGEIHSHEEQRINDGVINEVVKEHHPECRLVRFHKDELNGTEEDFKHYVNEKLLGLSDPLKTQII